MKTKTIFQTLILLFFVITAAAQQGINYKAIINDANGDALINTAVTIQFTILEDGTTEVYKETHTPTTDANGIIIVNIGEGTIASESGAFNDINWGGTPHFLNTKINTGSGPTDMGTTEFKTVPYALHAKTVESIGAPLSVSTSGDTLFFGLDEYVVIPGISAANTPIIDGEGNQLGYIAIGNQYWLSENLKTTHYNDGTNIKHVQNTADWSGLEESAYCWYENDQPTYGNTYGTLYNWYVVDAESNGGKNVCPVGWHVPTRADWRTLIAFLGGNDGSGGRIKESGFEHWESPNSGATNETGFTALPGGQRGEAVLTVKEYFGFGQLGSWWCSGEDLTFGFVSYTTVKYNNDYCTIYSGSKDMGLSIRCVRD